MEVSGDTIEVVGGGIGVVVIDSTVVDIMIIYVHACQNTY